MNLQLSRYRTLCLRGLQLTLIPVLLFAQLPDSIVVYKTVDTVHLRLHFFFPSDWSHTDRRAAIVFFHGGGWNNGDPKSFYPQSEHLASRGMVAISVQYRLRDVHGTTPRECVMDGRSAIRWVRAHADEFGIDPARIAAGGGSAGGQVAAAAGSANGFDEPSDDLAVDPRPCALVLFNPVIDNGLTGYGYKRVSEYWKGFSPMHNVDETSPPTLFMLGTRDHLVPTATAYAYRDELRRHGVRCDLILYPGQEHAFFHKARFRETLEETDGFLASLGLLSRPQPRTIVEIRGERFFINGEPTYKGRSWQGSPIEGLLFNSRMVQGIFDDLNPETRGLWKYPDTGIWDPDRNTSDFIAAMGEWRAHGLLAFTLNLQGGSPTGYGNKGWTNSAFTEQGALRPEYLFRLDRILRKADELGMVVILGLFYFGQDQILRDEAAVGRAVDNVIDWLFHAGYRNVIIEINNECDVKSYDHEILKPARVRNLISRVRGDQRQGYQFLVGTSFRGGAIPNADVVAASDLIFLHGNGVHDPKRIGAMVDSIRALDCFRPMPILFNEDDHYDFDKPVNNFSEAVRSYASWGYFDYRMKGETDYREGFQSVPVDWQIGSERKRGFFGLLKSITGTSE